LTPSIDRSNPDLPRSVRVLQGLHQVTAPFDGRFDGVWQELLITNAQSLVDASSDSHTNQYTSHKSMAIRR